MTDRIALTHRIEHRFSRRIQLSTHWLRLRPAPHARGIEAYSLRLDAEPHFLNWLRDPYENYLARLDLPDPLFGLGFDVEIIAELGDINPFDFLVEPYAANYPFEYPQQLRKELAPYLRIDRPGPWLTDWFSALDRQGGSIVDKLGAITRTVGERIPGTGVSTPGWVDVEALLQRGSGSPWETAWLLTLSLRGLGLAARFTSGFRIWLSDSPDIPDAAAAHAWTEVFLPGGGWIGLDPSSGLFTGKGYVPLASAPDPLRTLPVSGYAEACEEERHETLSLRRLAPTTPAWPYESTVWDDIDVLGARIDAELHAADVRMMLGSGLSFISARNPTAAEWTNTALGPDKRQAGEMLLSALAQRLGTGGVMHVGQGEWYNGEELPRWRLGYYRRADRQPIWPDQDLSGWRRRRGLTVRAEDVRIFAEEVAKALRLPPSFVIPAHEDGLHQLWQSQTGVDWHPSAEELRDPERRRHVAECLSASHGEPAGFVLPLRWDPVKHRWTSGVWTFRRAGLYLIPGQSPLGFRLPIDSLPVGEAGAAESDPERCQTEERPVLPSVCGEPSARYTTVALASDGFVEEADRLAHHDGRPPRTALAVELRDGNLYVFLPPLTHLEHFLDLVGAVHAAARATGISALLEGYEPPEDYRLERIQVEPEPGILKVWLPEVAGWQSQRDMIAAAYETAARIGLCAERVLLDGRRLPPGGSAELVLGGRNPVDSPFLRRPELLRSLIVYWQQHPSLSYLFAGRLVGPDGPAPRPDEGREDALYELSIALDRIPQGEVAQPWIPDRLLRHLLADPAGNMKRAEIRMDLLYAPDRPSFRLGKTVLRSFEMPPHPQLAALQSLLVAALVAAFWREPRRGKLVDWGAALHDRFMLPCVLWDDLTKVLEDLARADLPLQAEWFRPLLDLRFPVLGRTQIGDLALELRAAHEPWPLLAEETILGGGTARFLDSSCERIQVRCEGLAPSRYALACNGYRVPLSATGLHGEYAAGIRFKVWNPPSTLHPTITPAYGLVIDLIDTWSGKIIGGCTYLPPRPDVWGAAAAPKGLAVPEGPRRPDAQRLPSVYVPPWGSGGVFLPKGSAPPNTKRDTPLADATPRPGHPYLLDLARMF